LDRKTFLKISIAATTFSAFVTGAFCFREVAGLGSGWLADFAQGIGLLGIPSFPGIVVGYVITMQQAAPPRNGLLEVGLIAFVFNGVFYSILLLAIFGLFTKFRGNAASGPGEAH
jgi:hypothetical protein